MKRFLLSIIILFSTLGGYANKFSVNISYPKIVEKDDVFRISYIANEKVDINYPKFKNFELVGGPSVSSSSSVSIINGNITKKQEYTYTLMLQAIKVGTFEIEAATMAFDGKNYATIKPKIQVLKANPNKRQQQRSNSRFGNQQRRATNSNVNISKENIFLNIEFDKNSVYINEPILATVNFYTRYDIASNQNPELPDFNGFWKQDIESRGNNRSVATVNGKQYNRYTIGKFLLFPQKTGKIKIDPASIKVGIRQRISSGGRGFFDDFFGTSQVINKEIKSKAYTINVKDFPAKSANFENLVGDFRIFSKADKLNTKTNEPVTITVEISGEGNLQLVDPPEFDFPSDFELYDPKTTQNINTTEQGINGSVKFEYLFIPRHGGEYKVPPASLTFFNPKTKRYKTLKTKSFVFNIEKGAEDNSNYRPASGLQKEDLKTLDSDIRYIKSNIKEGLERRQQFLVGEFKYFLYYIIVLASFFILYFIQRKNIEDNKDIKHVKNKRARKLAKKRLKQASISLKENNKSEFYNELLKAMWGYVSDKFNLNIAQVKRDTISEIFQEHNIEEELQAEFIKFADDCEFAHFAPSANVDHKMADLYKQAEQLILKLEKTKQ